MQHVGLHNIEPKVFNHFQQFSHTLLVGGNLRSKVGDVLVGVAGGPGMLREKLSDAVLIEVPVRNKLEVVD